MAIIEPLRPFQEEDFPFFLAHPKSLILYEPRLGKTVLSCNILARDINTSSVLIACSKNAMSVWIDHLRVWWAHLRSNQELEIRIIRGKHSDAKAQRLAEWKRPRKEGVVTVYLTTFQALLFDYDYIKEQYIRFDTIIADEVHKVLKSRTTKSAKMFRELVRAKTCRRFHALSGTLVGKWGPGDYWTLLNICSRDEHPSYWQWMNTFCITINNGWGTEVVGLQNIDQFHRHMSRFARVRKRKECAPQMPAVQRDIIWVDMTPEQERMFEEMGQESFTFTESGSIIVAANSLEKMTRKRQFLACPKISDPTASSYGGAFNHLLETLIDARENEDVQGHHVVIFTAVRKAIEHFDLALRSNSFHTSILVGGTEPEDLVQIIEEFRANKGVLLCTTQFAQAFSLEPATVSYHIGWDFDPNNNKQAEDRLVPQRGVNPIMSYYYCYRASDDDLYAERLNLRNQIMSITTTATVKPLTWK